MTSSSFAPEPGRGPSSTAVAYSSSTPQEAHRTNHSTSNNNNNNTALGNNSSSSGDNTFHAHRQNHNSSKLPAFRFADLKKDRISLPSLLQQIPPSPLSPRTTPDDQTQQKTHQQTPRVPGSSRDTPRQHNGTPKRPASFETQHQASVSLPPRSRSLKFHLPTSAASADLSAGSKRPASFPDTPRLIGSVYATRSQLSYVATPVTKRRLTASSVAHDAPAPAESRAHLSSNRPQPPKPDGAGDTNEAAPALESATKTIDAPTTEDKKPSRPPISYKPPNTTTSTPAGRAVIPPIRSFRSSGSRKSVVLDMQSRRASEDSFGEEAPDSNQRDRALCALEGRANDDFSHLAPPDSGDMTTTTDNDNTADIFMRIAGEDMAHRGSREGQGKVAEQTAVSRIARSAHRRPLSAAIPSYQTTSPPQLSRRLSDQRESARSRANSQSAQEITRELAYRTTTRENLPAAATAPDTASRVQAARTSLRPSPITPRQISFQDSFGESASGYQRRRQSIPDSNSVSTVKNSQPRNSNFASSQGRTYNSSPLVPKSANVQKDEPQHGAETNPGVEGTESSSSTAAPSTVWDELDDLKSRIHRLELTGKMAASAMTTSRTSDDRPPTATTNATTMSASPKRGSGAGAPPVDASSNASFTRETQPLLLSALSKTKGVVSSDVFNAIESAATDALALSSMMGAPGQPGPISSGASTLGINSGVTDRQLRRKADSICRSLTELCIALTAESGQTKQPKPTATARENELLLSPTSIHPATASAQRRPSAIADTVAKPSVSPRAPTILEQRRQTMLASTVLPSPRTAAAPTTPMEPMSAGRKSSLLLARIRRAATEEPEEQPGRRSSLLLRTRRAGTEEPEDNGEGRKTSLLLRSRKTMNEEEDEAHFRAPSRAITEVNGFRGAAPRDISSQNAQPPVESTSAASSALPRRRFLPSSLNTRLVTLTNGSGPASAPVTPARRYLERATPERETVNSNHIAEKYAEERGQRQVSLSQSVLLQRSGSLGRRNRESGISGLQSTSSSAQFAQAAAGSGSDRSGREGGGGHYR